MSSRADFLLELRSEEIPARMQARARADLERLFREELATAGLDAQAITTYASPRRLALIARGVPVRTQALSEERKGPRADAPEPAIAGFLRSTGLTRDQLVERTDAKGVATLFAVIERPGRPAIEPLGDAIARIIRAFPWPKSMRWGAASREMTSLRWVRPLHGIMALLGDAEVPVMVDGVASGRETCGHRFLHAGPVTIADAASYVETLRAAHVIVDPEERMAIIREGAQRLAREAGLTLVEDEGLVAENAGLTEWPVPLMGDFDPGFLAVPEEVIQLTTRINQKYFVVRDAAGALAPRFICTANIAAKDGGAAIVAGNQKVLAARLADARFFWENDLKVPLDEQAKKLDRIVFHEKLGTVADKVARVAKLARWLVEQGVVPGADPDEAERAARLAKADLVTGMVGEFPELQGVIGGHLARAQGESDAVADAIRDHYKPAGQGDTVPTAPVTVAVSLADKIDTLSTFFWAKMPPSGSKDPFALRRAALGVSSLMQANGLRFDLPSALGQPIDHLLVDFPKMGENRSKDYVPDLLAFLVDRLKVQQREAGVRHDLIDAVFALGGEGDLLRLLARVKALQGMVDTAGGIDLLAGYKRATSILKKEGITTRPEAVAPADAEPAEAALGAALDAAEPAIEAALVAEDYPVAMNALAGLRMPVDRFFTEVTVNDADPAKRLYRLGLLARLRDAAHRIADFSKIEG